MYDVMLIGAGLFNAVIAYELKKRGYKCAVLEKRDHLGGNCYTYIESNIVVHKYGAHIFRTDDDNVWEYVNQFAEFNNFINSPIAKYKNEVYNLPFNMNTFSKMWGISTPEEAFEIIENQKKRNLNSEDNLENYAINLVGYDIYEKLIKGYTQKQWGRPCNELPASIMRRIPVRYTYDNNYFDSKYQGIPIGGYTPIFEKMFDGCDVYLNVDYLENRKHWNKKTKQIIYTGTIDSFFDYKYGALEYRSLYFETEKHENIDNYQGVAVVNYTSVDEPYTRIIEHKHFEFGKQKGTIISKEYPLEWHLGIEPYYPINNEGNNKRYLDYFSETQKQNKIMFGGRLGQYQYFDMQDTIKAAWKLVARF